MGIKVNEDAKKIELRLARFINLFGKEVETKFSNLNGKTGSYYVPDNIFQKRTPRQNRVLIPWEYVKYNELTLSQLETFYNGVTIEFKNDDFFNPDTTDESLLKLYNFLKNNRIGSDENVSAIITFHSDGTSSSQKSRDSYQKFLNNTEVIYKGNHIKINKENIMNYYLKSTKSNNCTNKYWTGFIFIDISGGQQDTIQSHTSKTNQTIFNPACEYANEAVCNDIRLVMGYYILKSIKPERDIKKIQDKSEDEYIRLTKEYYSLLKDIEKQLKKRKYSNKLYKGTLYNFIKNEALVLKNVDNMQLLDPIQMIEITIDDFIQKDTRSENSLDIAHERDVDKHEFYWDEELKCILSPAMPTNIFWSKHLSNMMQQNFSVREYHEKDMEMVEKRKLLFK